MLLIICNYANESGQCYPSRETIAKKTSMSVRSVQSHINWLSDQGYLTWTNKRKKGNQQTPNVYQLPSAVFAHGNQKPCANYAEAECKYCNPPSAKFAQNTSEEEPSVTQRREPSPLSESAFAEYRKEVVEWYCSKLNIVSLPPRTDVSTDLRWLFTNNFTVSDLDAFYDFAKAETWRKGKITISAIAKGIGDWRSQQQSTQKKPAVSIPVNCTLGCNPDTGLREVVKDGQIAMVRCKHK